MDNVLKLMKLDYYTVKADYLRFGFAYVLAAFLAAVKQPTLAVVVVMAFSVFFSGMVFSIYEKNNLSKLYGILPLRKLEVVTGRYIYVLLFGIINGIASGCLAYIVSLFADKVMDQITFLAYLSASFLYFCLAVGVSFPIYFKFGFSKAYMFTILPLYIVFLGGIFISRKTSVLNNLFQIIQYFTSHQYMILVTGIGLGLVLLIISCLISYVIYKRNEL